MAQVKKGDTISAIAAKAKVSVAAIAAANPQIKNLNKISVGQTINIPKVDTTVKTSTKTYAGGLTGGSNPFAAGSTASQATKDKLAGAAGFTPTTKVTGGTDGGTDGGTTPPPTADEFLAAGTVISSSSVPNGDGTFTVTTIYADGKGGTYQQVTQSGTPDKKEPDTSKDTRDAFALLTSTFALYGLDELAPVIAGYMKQGLTSNEAIIELRQNKTYQTRFAGNTARTTAGLNALSEGEYLALEDSYSETLRAYGQQTLLGTDKKTRQAKMATIIGADISPVEFKDRVSTVVTRVENADPLVKSTLRDFYKITDTDLVSYFLNPTENLPKLQEKVTAAEIGSAALAQGGLTTDMTSAESLAKFGVDLATARKGYSTISEVLPTATKLSQIYNEENIQYNQKVAEEEVFKGLASAQRKRTQLAEKEIASFQGSSGVGAAGLSTTYLRKGSAAGQF
jgi:LysM repeat protein